MSEVISISSDSSEYHSSTDSEDSEEEYQKLKRHFLPKVTAKDVKVAKPPAIFVIPPTSPSIPPTPPPLPPPLPAPAQSPPLLPSSNSSSRSSIPSSLSSSPSIDEQISPGDTGKAIDPADLLDRLEQIHNLYRSRPREPKDEGRYQPVQWPKTPTSARHKRYCLCKTRVTLKQRSTTGVTCFDPNCAVPNGWYHLKCTDLDKDAVASGDRWVCKDCTKYRYEKGFPELGSSYDRYSVLQEKVLARQSSQLDDEYYGEGMSPHERQQAAKIDAMLKKTNKWPPFADTKASRRPRRAA